MTITFTTEQLAFIGTCVIIVATAAMLLAGKWILEHVTHKRRPVIFVIGCAMFTIGVISGIILMILGIIYQITQVAEIFS